MQLSALLLALPCLVPALARPHTLRHQVDSPHLGKREIYAATEASLSKAHLGMPPANADSLQAVAGMRQVRRKRRSMSSTCGASNSRSTGNSTTSIGEVGASVPSGTMPTTQPTQEAASPPVSDNSTWSQTGSESTSSTAASTPSTSPTSNASSSGGGGLGGLLAKLFPIGWGTSHWTTADVDDSNKLSFNDALKPLTAGTLPTEGAAPDGSDSLIANYPAGTFGLSSHTHGWSFYTEGEHDGVEVEGAKEVLFSYSIFFEAGFDFVKGGKLPGLYGGTSKDLAKSCSGGKQDGRDDCFSGRIMWRTDGAGELYNYFPSAVYDNKNYCATGPLSKCDKVYGDSIGRGAFSWPTGEWANVALRMKLNDEGQANGEQEIFINGESKINLTGLAIGVKGGNKFYGIMAQTFFGGSDDSWASPKDQSAYFKDWSLAVLA